MQFDFRNASLKEILDYTPDLRRDAYVDAALKMQADDNIAGIFGSAYSAAQSPVIDEALIYGFGLVPVPVVGVDAFIFRYGNYPACDALKSTMVYLTTQKCPLLYSSKMYVLDGLCPIAEQAFRSCTQKPVYVCGSAEAEDLKTVLAAVYGRDFSPERYQTAQVAYTQLAELLNCLERSALSGNDFGMLAFYSHFIFDLDERIAFLTRVCRLLTDHSECSAVQGTAVQMPTRVPVSVHCPDGIIQKMLPEAGTYFKPVPPHGRADIACAGCVHPADRYVPY